MGQETRGRRVFDIAEILHERFGVRTLLTSVEEIPSEYARLGWVEAHSNADCETYERILERGDLPIWVSEYETLAHTWFKQAASGQVLLLLDERWVYDCVLEDHPLVAPLDTGPDINQSNTSIVLNAVAENRQFELETDEDN